MPIEQYGRGDEEQRTEELHIVRHALITLALHIHKAHRNPLLTVARATSKLFQREEPTGCIDATGAGFIAMGHLVHYRIRGHDDQSTELVNSRTTDS
jgi:glycerol uptake facilitator-like aquaporin